MEYYSQNKQDLIILEYLNNKTNGYFLDIGCGYPKTINNTFLFETHYNWNGLSIDIHDFQEHSGENWYDIRKTKQILDDALEIDYYKLLRDNNVPKVIDFLTMDLEPPDLTLDALYKIPFDVYQFNLILFEIDDEREPFFEKRKSESRKFLKSKGYNFIGNIGGQDDLYLHNTIITNVDFYQLLINIGIPDYNIKHFNPQL
jgi:hypothetical protein